MSWGRIFILAPQVGADTHVRESKYEPGMGTHTCLYVSSPVDIHPELAEIVRTYVVDDDPEFSDVAKTWSNFDPESAKVARIGAIFG